MCLRETKVNLEFSLIFFFFPLRRMFSARKSSMENVWPAVLLSLDLETHAIHGNPHLTWSFKEVTGFCAHTSFEMSKCFSICFCLLSIHSSPRKNTGKFPLWHYSAWSLWRDLQSPRLLIFLQSLEQGLDLGSLFRLQGIFIWRLTSSLQEITETTWIYLDMDWPSELSHLHCC